MKEEKNKTQETPEIDNGSGRTRIRVKKKKKAPVGKKILLSVIGVLLVLIIAAGVVATKMYFDVKGTFEQAHESIDRIETSLGPSGNATGNSAGNTATIAEEDPFSVLLLGIDTGELGRTEHGRSDTIMVATINPNTKRTTLTSIPRDIYTEIVGHGTSDKLNHAYAFGGAAMAIASVENLLSVPINHFVQINMKGLEDLVDAVGGIQVENTLDFTITGINFPKGTVMLDGTRALAYIRMRYDDPNGDFGRQGRQRDVIAAVIKKTLNFDNLTKYQTILSAVSANMKTDLTWDQMKDIALNYQPAFTTITMDQMQAPGGLSDGSIGEKGIYYQQPTQEEITRVQTQINNELQK